MISFIVPAHNEELWLPRCLGAITSSMQSEAMPYELIVVNDASSDATPRIAKDFGATLINVQHRQISASRNAGANASSGDVLFFVDADTLMTATIVRSALETIAAGAVGGGCIARFEGRLPLWFRATYPLMVFVMRRVLNQTGGAFLFCTREAFDATGGFSEEQYAAEEDVWVKSFKRHGKFVLLAEPIVTSGRNLRSQSFFSFISILLKLAVRGAGGFRSREGLDIWYQPKREKSA